MIKINKYTNTTKPKVVIKNGVSYKEMDLGGGKILIRIKSDKELAKDYKAFKKYSNDLKNK